MTEKEHTKVNVIEVSPMGYGNEASSISYDKKLASGDLKYEVANNAEQFIKSGEGLITVHEKDDGCIDGRTAQHVYDNVTGELYEDRADNSNHERAKVAGGGYLTALVARLGAGVRGETISGDVVGVAADLAGKGIVCGAHSGAHQHGEGTDCGANDKIVDILRNGEHYKEHLAGDVAALLEIAGLVFKRDVFESVIENWQDAINDEAYIGGSTGKERLDTILGAQAAINDVVGDAEKPAAVTKHLEGDHNEAFIIVNFVEGKTFSQSALREHVRGEFPELADEDLPQAFVVDAWRVVELATNAVNDDEAEQAIYAGVIFQLATAATLTDGTLKTVAYAGA